MSKLEVYRGNRFLGTVLPFASDDATLAKAKARAKEKFGAGVRVVDPRVQPTALAA